MPHIDRYFLKAIQSSPSPHHIERGEDHPHPQSAHAQLLQANTESMAQKQQSGCDPALSDTYYNPKP